jgi:Ca2+-binding RTX toxin-like protein
MEALKPPEVLEAQRRQGLKGKDRRRRKNAAYVRQGEWFFLPAPKLHVDKKLVLCREPLSRGTGSKPHWAEFLYRTGGETVYVCDAYPQGLRWNFAGGPGGDDFAFLPNYGVDGKLDGILTGNSGTLDYSQANRPVTVNLANNSASNIDGGLAGGISSISAMIGNNKHTTLVGMDLANTWNITGANQGTVSNSAGSFPFSQVANLTGGGGTDNFVFQQAGSVSGAVDGGAGTNTLDYSHYTGDIRVDLLTGAADLVNQDAAGSVANIADVTGSIGNDLLVGDAGASVLIGGTGRNVLIGGAGSDTLDASRATSDNILIGGRTDFDVNAAALNAVFAEWRRTDLGFADRMSDLTSGRNSRGVAPLNTVNGQRILLTPATNPTSTNGTVHADTLPDTLIGSTLIDPATHRRVHNWFFFDADDTLVNFLASSDRRTRMR